MNTQQDKNWNSRKIYSPEQTYIASSAKIRYEGIEGGKKSGRNKDKISKNARKKLKVSNYKDKTAYYGPAVNSQVDFSMPYSFANMHQMAFEKSTSRTRAKNHLKKDFNHVTLTERLYSCDIIQMSPKSNQREKENKKSSRKVLNESRKHLSSSPTAFDTTNQPLTKQSKANRGSIKKRKKQKKS